MKVPTKEEYTITYDMVLEKYKEYRPFVLMTVLFICSLLIMFFYYEHQLDACNIYYQGLLKDAIFLK